MTFFKKVTIALLCTAAPSAMLAQAVELRSLDNFISVEGEITAFNGTLVTILTSVGPISIPASEVVCYGAACDTVLDANDFGLTAAAFAGVIGQPDPAAPAVQDTLAISFASPAFLSLYRTLTGAFAVSNQTTATLEIESATQIALANAAGNETAILTVAAADDAGDARVASIALTGRMAQHYAGPSDWADTTTPSHQMLALRAFAVVAGPDHSVEAVTLDQLAGIYAGDITNWSQIGGADLPVLPLQLPGTSDVRDEMITVVMEPADKTIAPSVLTMADEGAISLSVSGLPGSISLVDTASIGDASVLPVAGSCGFAVSPSDFNVASGDYPLLRPVMVRFDTPVATPIVAELFDFAAAGGAQGLIAREGFVEYSASPQDPADRNARLAALLTADLDPVERPVAAQMFQVLFEAERLTPTLIGGATSAAEGAWNRAMLRNLTEWLLRPDYAGREVIFAGFGDSSDGPQDAIDTSIRAAEQMAATFTSFAPEIVAGNDLTITAAGFGAVSRTTCYDSHVVGPAQSRVEVWIK